MLLQFFTLIVLLVVVTARHCYDEYVEASSLNNNLEKLQLDTNYFVKSTSEVLAWNQVNTKRCPVIVSREKWKARPPVAKELMKTPVRYVILHHTEEVRCHEYEKCCKVVRNIQDVHITDRGWNDIGYTFLIGEDGNIYEGRGWDTIGAHCPWYNSQSIGISIMGNFREVIPDTSALNAVQTLIKCAIQSGRLSPDYILYGHRQGRKGKECPGEALFKEVQSWPHWKPGNHFPPDGT